MASTLARKAWVTAAVLISILPAGLAWGASRNWNRDWATLENSKHGFLIAYPIEVFQQRSDPAPGDGRVLYSRDGKAQLLVGAFTNEDATSMQAYRQYLMQEQYAGANITYAPVHRRWFVLSGTMGDQEFYERVSFTCGGRLINSWAMIYPHAENRFYDRIVEAIARTYTPGAGRTGNCD